MDRVDFDRRVAEIVRQIKTLKTAIDNNEINADTEQGYSSDEGWARIQQALDDARNQAA